MASATLATIIHSGLALAFNALDHANPNNKDIGFNNSWEFSQELVAIVLLLTFTASIFSSFIISEVVKRIGTTNAELTGTVGPIMTSIMTVVVLNEIFTFYHGLGMILVIIGVSRLKPKKLKLS